MSKQRDLKQHHQNLMEVREIMNSMKTLAFMETHKLENHLPPQQARVEHIETVAEDFFHSFPEFNNTSKLNRQAAKHVFVLVGSERGFCADFNQRLIEEFLQIVATNSATFITIAIGQRLISALEERNIENISFEGASVYEETESVMLAVVDKILSLQERQALLVSVLCHDERGQIVKLQLLPPFQTLPPAPTERRIEPLIYMDKKNFVVHLSSHYVYAKILEILYISLLLENQLRVAHLQSALNRLDESLEQLQKRINAQRQEEIIEEIEVILLSE